MFYPLFLILHLDLNMHYNVYGSTSLIVDFCYHEFFYLAVSKCDRYCFSSVSVGPTDLKLPILFPLRNADSYLLAL